MMHDLNQIDLIIEQRTALDRISYAAQALLRWAIKTDMYRARNDMASVAQYLTLIDEDIAKILEHRERLRRALDAASLQHDPRETSKEAA